jgi:hypothetical protein
MREAGKRYSGEIRVYEGKEFSGGASESARSAEVSLSDCDKAEEFGPFRFKQGPLLCTPGKRYTLDQEHGTKSGQLLLTVLPLFRLL